MGVSQGQFSEPADFEAPRLATQRIQGVFNLTLTLGILQSDLNCEYGVRFFKKKTHKIMVAVAMDL